MPRKSLAALNTPARVDGRPERLQPPAGLSEAGTAVWLAIVAAVPPEHFRPSDAPLLRSFCEATTLADQAAAEICAHGPVIAGRASPWIAVQEKATRTQATLALRLRLCPSARVDPKVTGRERTPPSGAKPWTYGK